MRFVGTLTQQKLATGAHYKETERRLTETEARPVGTAFPKELVQRKQQQKEAVQKAFVQEQTDIQSNGNTLQKSQTTRDSKQLIATGNGVERELVEAQCNGKIVGQCLP